MLLISSLCVIPIFVIAYASIFIIQVDSQLPSSAVISARRSQSMSMLSIRPKITPNVKSETFASTSTGQTSVKKTDPKDIPSTSEFEEIDLQSPIKEAKQANQVKISPVDLTEASMGTHNGIHLNPARDGINARIRQYGSSAATAAAAASVVAIGGIAGGIAIERSMTPKNTNNAFTSASLISYNTNITQTLNNLFDDSDEIVNHF